MKSLFLPLVIFLLLISSISIFDLESYKANYDIVGDKVKVNLDIGLKEGTTHFAWKLPADAQDIQVVGASHDVMDMVDYKLLNIIGKRFDHLKISYITDSFLQQQPGQSLFLDLGRREAESNLISFQLPEDAALRFRIEPKPEEDKTKTVLLKYTGSTDIATPTIIFIMAVLFMTLIGWAIHNPRDIRLENERVNSLNSRFNKFLNKLSLKKGKHK